MKVKKQYEFNETQGLELVETSKGGHIHNVIPHSTSGPAELRLRDKTEKTKYELITKIFQL